MEVLLGSFLSSMNENLYEYTFKFEPDSQFTCTASDLFEALKHLELATGVTKCKSIVAKQIYRAPFIN